MSTGSFAKPGPPCGVEGRALHDLPFVTEQSKPGASGSRCLVCTSSWLPGSPESGAPFLTQLKSILLCTFIFGSRLYFPRTVLGLQLIEGTVQGFPLCPQPYAGTAHSTPAPPASASPTSVVSLLQSVSPRRHLITSGHCFHRGSLLLLSPPGVWINVQCHAPPVTDSCRVVLLPPAPGLPISLRPAVCSPRSPARSRGHSAGVVQCVAPTSHFSSCF